MSKSVVVHFRGRLGNQLFEYYTALALARRIGAEVYFDPHWENQNRLEVRSIVPLGEASTELLVQLRGGSSWSGKLKRLLQRLRPLAARSFWIEPGQAFDSRLLRARSSCFLDGYWQSYKYFEDLAPSEFQPLRSSLAQLASLDRWLDRAREAVVIHVRLTDYKGTFPILTLDYYRQAMALFPGRRFLVVSDDPAECQQLFSGIAGVEVLTDTGRTLWQDLNLMVEAAGVIAANSTFSWWGAYLNPRPEAKVVVPL